MGDVERRTAGVADHRRLCWRSRRGMLELELALAPFVRHRLAGLGESGKRAYARLLEHDDLDIYEWIQGRQEAPDDELTALVEQVRSAAAAAAPGGA